MDIQINKGLVLDEISEEYSALRNEAAKIEQERNLLIFEMQNNRSTISHNEWVNSSFRIDCMKERIKNINFKADGLGLAREIVFNIK